MDPIDGNRRSLDLIRRRLAEQLQQLRGGDAGAVAAAPSTGMQAARPRLQDVVIRKIRAIPRDDAHHLEKSVQAFVESVLLEGLGEDLVNNPEFREMTVEVGRIMLDDPRLKTQLSELTRQLMQGS